jgi:hypothetical protein
MPHLNETIDAPTDLGQTLPIGIRPTMNPSLSQSHCQSSLLSSHKAAFRPLPGWRRLDMIVVPNLLLELDSAVPPPSKVQPRSIGSPQTTVKIPFQITSEPSRISFVKPIVSIQIIRMSFATPLMNPILVVPAQTVLIVLEASVRLLAKEAQVAQPRMEREHRPLHHPAAQRSLLHPLL